MMTGEEPIYTERKTCRVCDSKTLVEVINFGNQYLCTFPEETDTTLPKAPLNLVRCAHCGLLQLQHTTNLDILYREYWYRSGVNETMRSALKDVVSSTLDFCWGGNWLDIGANDGTLLSCLPKEFKTFACEPAVTFHDQLNEHCDTLIPTYFSKSAVRDQCDSSFDVITSCAMFYDLDDPNAFVADIASVLTHNGIWVNQLNDSPTMLRTNGFDGICHEHLCYYSVHDLKDLYDRHGLVITRIEHNNVNGGSVRLFAGRKGVYPETSLAGIPRQKMLDCQMFAERVERWKSITQSILYAPSLHSQPIWAYGASTKGTMLMQYLDAGERFVAVADRNPAKWGKRMVGTWLPITDEMTMRKAHPRYLFVLPWAFRKEFVEREQQLRAEGTTMIFPLPNLEFVE